MSEILDELIDLLSLERLEEDLFRGSSRDIGTKRVYGGQVLGQALKAAQYTVEDRTVHSLHAYFLRTGDHHAPIIYEVDRSRDGRSFSARRVVAIQHGRPIFTLAASFQLAEAGLEHQPDMPDVPNPDSASQHLIYSQADVDQMPDKLQRIVRLAAPFEFRTVEPIDLEQPVRSIPERHVWLRVAEKLPDDTPLHYAMLAYISDYALLPTALLPHGVHYHDVELQMASLDHAMWFHRAFRMDEWLLYSLDSPSAAHARGFARGQFYKADGTLVVSTVQEGLIRVRDGAQK